MKPYSSVFQALLLKCELYIYPVVTNILVSNSDHISHFISYNLSKICSEKNKPLYDSFSWGNQHWVSVHSSNNCNHYFFHLNCASVHLINTIFHRLPSRHQARTDHMWLYYRIFGILKQLGLRGAILLVKIEIAGNPWSTLVN